MPLIVLDAGHGGANPGATYQGRQEKDDVLALTLAVGQILENRGVDVYYTRTTDVYESPAQKALEGNQTGADYFGLHPPQFQSLSQPVQRNRVSGLQPLWGRGQTG